MRSVKDKIVYFVYEGNIDSRNNKLLLQEIEQLKSEIDPKKHNAIFISLKHANFNLEHLLFLVKRLNIISQEISIPIALGDFTTVMYDILKKETKNTSIKIFKTFGLAKLFLSTSSFKKKLKVLMFDDGEDEDELDRQAAMLTKFEHNILYTKDMEEFRTKISDPNVDFAVSQTKINLTPVKKDRTKKRFLLSKTLIMNLPIFTDIAVQNIETMTSLKATKISHRVDCFDTSIDDNIISSIMQFKGDIEGEFVLVFPKDVAVFSIESMLGEKIDEQDNDSISDGIGEFCNIIIGGVKTALSKKDISIKFDLPKTFTSIIATTNQLPKNSGIWIDMKLEDKPFYMYITK